MSSNTTFKAYAELAKQRRGLQQSSFRGYELTHVGPGTSCGEYFRRFLS
jgi:hypothetical protein